jgi:hypothetical protein
LFGRFFSVTEVLQVVTEEWGIGVSRMTMNRFAQAYAEEIREKQEWYKKNYSDVRLGYKRSRLDELSWMYTSAKIKYNGGNRSNDTGRLMVSILQQIKAEVEGDIDIRVSGSIDMNIEHTLSVHVRHELMKSLNINSLIISRVALKLGLNPIILMNRLQSSYYKKFTTLNGDVPENPDTMELPSKLPYDFKQIQDAQVVIDTNEAKEAAKLKKEQEEQNELGKEGGFKDRLLRMLQEKNEEMAVAKRRVNVLAMGREAREADGEQEGELKRLDKMNKKKGWVRGKKRKKKLTKEERIAQDIKKANSKKDL